MRWLINLKVDNSLTASFEPNFRVHMRCAGKIDKSAMIWQNITSLLICDRDISAIAHSNLRDTGPRGGIKHLSCNITDC